MKVYLVEKVDGGHLEPLGVFKNKGDAIKTLGSLEGIVTEMELDKSYPNGIGVCKHWHLNDKSAVEITL